MSVIELSTADRMVSSSRSASKMTMTSYGRMDRYLLRTARRPWLRRAPGPGEALSELAAEGQGGHEGSPRASDVEPGNLAGAPQHGPIAREPTPGVRHTRRASGSDRSDAQASESCWGAGSTAPSPARSIGPMSMAPSSWSVMWYVSSLDGKLPARTSATKLETASVATAPSSA